MPSVSKSQFRLMQAIAHGNISKKGLSKNKAKEFVEDVDYKNLPEKRKFSKLKSLLKGK